jgi:hypothetical protein
MSFISTSIFDLLIAFQQQSTHNLWWEVFSLSSLLMALVLFAIAIRAYKRHRLKRLFLLSSAFGLFVLKVCLLHLDFFYPILQVELNVASVAVEFGMLSMIFLAMVKK